MHRIHELVEERSGRKLPADFDDTFHSRVFAAFQAELEAVDGAADVLKGLVAAGVPYCVASSGSHERIRVGHRKTGLDVWFRDEIVFSADDVGRGKPWPDLFLHAAARMGVAPERCVVVEDSGPGVQAALAAGMDAYGFTAMTAEEKLDGAKGFFRRMDELPAILGM
jgi:HAD superfamily hydrolase (TIGR01509 family)